MTAWAVKRSGGKPIRITPSTFSDETALHGLIIGGGTDIDPIHYGDLGQKTTPENPDQTGSVLDWAVGLVLSFFRILFSTGAVQNYDPERDKLEMRLIRYALYHDLPVLGICRGAQLMNVSLGGTLHQSIEHFYSEEAANVRSILPRKRITLELDSRLQTILQTQACVVNALHDQSINTLGDGITVSATERSGVIQAIECRRQDFFVGVQWHPEYMPQSRIQQNLFRGLLHCALSAKIRNNNLAHR
jgi:putative glutamine amidotransferase